MLASLPRGAWWLLALVAALAWFAPLDFRHLQHPDEGRYAEIAREMAASGDFVTPRLNDLKYFEKPPLQYWLGALAFTAFGVDEWTARLPTAVAGFLAVIAIGFAGARLAGREAGVYAGLVLLGCVWHVGMGHLLSLDGLLAFCMTLALCAFLLAQRDGLAPREVRWWMLACYAALAAATLTKGLVAPAVAGATLVLYSLVARDAGPWRRLHPVAGTLVFLAIAAPWFVLVSARNPEFAHFFFVHEHFQRFLTETHNRTGEWWYFVPWFVLGLMPWLVVWLVALPRSILAARRNANGFCWERFCLVWAAFIIVFFSLSGSKLPSYILPMFPALALVIGFELTRLSSRALMWIALPLALGGAAVAIGGVVAWDRLAAEWASESTPLPIYREFGPWVLAAILAYTAGGVLATACFHRGTPATRTLGVVALSFSSLIALSIAFVGNDAFAAVRSAAPLLAAAERANGGPLDPRYPVYQIGSYDQTLPFYLQRPTPLVEYRDEMALGLDAEPDKGYNLTRWLAAWEAAPQAYALFSHDTAADLEKHAVPMRVLVRDPRRIFVARR